MDINALILKAVDNPQTRIDRESFLRNVLFNYKKNVSTAQQELFLENPVKALEITEINFIADKIINNDLWQTSALSFAAGIPGGPWGLVAAAPDIVQNLGYYIALSQKLAYLYGVNFQGVNEQEEEYRQSSTLLCLGFMLGVTGTETVVQKIIDNAWKKSGREFIEYLMKTVIIKIAKNIAESLGQSLTKRSVSNILGKAVPLLGGLISGGITYAGFKKAALLMQKKLINFSTPNPTSYTPAPDIH